MRLSIIIFLVCNCLVFSQQVPDTLYTPKLEKGKYTGVIYVDEAHNNFHTINNRFLPFAKVLRKAGYTVKSFTHKFTDQVLDTVTTLVISNALSENARGPFVVPTKSAFTNKEVTTIQEWVHNGGALFLIADHMPFAGASVQLGQAFGFTFYDSFLLDENRRGIIDFTKENEMLGNHQLINGNEHFKKIKKIRAFTGQAFKIPSKAQTILKTTEKLIVHLPDTMWRFNEKTKRFPAKELSQGAVMKYGKGRIAIFGEAAMFTAQLAGPNQFKVGMNSEEASENYKLLLNIMNWLSGK